MPRWMVLAQHAYSPLDKLVWKQKKAPAAILLAAGPQPDQLPAWVAESYSVGMGRGVGQVHPGCDMLGRPGGFVKRTNYEFGYSSYSCPLHIVPPL